MSSWDETTLKWKVLTCASLGKASAAGILWRFPGNAVKLTQDQRWAADTASLHLLHTRLAILPNNF